MKVLYALVFVSALLSVYCQINQLDWLFNLFKPLTTILIIAVLVRFGDRNFPHYYWALLLGLIACLLGDVFLLNSNYFVHGLAAFLIAHLLFLYAFTSLGGFKPFPVPLLILAIVSGSFYLYMLPSLGAFAIPVAVYNSVIVLMVWQAVNLISWNRNSVTTSIALAAVAFMISDSVIAIDKFIVPFSWSSTVILPLYWLSIAVLSYSGIVIERGLNNAA